MSAAAWDEVVPLLVDRFELIVPTAAGHRGGPALTGPATFTGLVDDAERLLDARGLDAVHVAGNSLGGWMGIELARRGRARSVCALSPAGFWTPGSPDWARPTARIRRVGVLARATAPAAPLIMRSAALRRFGLRDVAVHGDRLTPEQALGSTRDLLACTAARELLRTGESVAPLDPLPCPVTLAWSERDLIFPPHVHGRTARERLPGARYVVLPGVGHVPMVDDPELTARTIREACTATVS